MRLILSRLFWLWVLCVPGSCLLPVSAAQDAQVRSEELQLKITAPCSRGFYLPLPGSRQGLFCRDVRVQAGDGRLLPCRKLLLSRSLAAVAVPSEKKDFPVTVLLQREPGEFKPSPQMQFDGQVLLQTREIALTTRAFTMSEMLRLSAFFGILKTAGSVNMPGELPVGGKSVSLLKVRNRYCRMLSWQAHFFLDQDRDFLVGVRSHSSAWLMLVDGRPVNGWKESALQCRVPLTAGSHRLQYFVFLNTGESIPVPVLQFARQSASAFREALVPWRMPSEITFLRGKQEDFSLKITGAKPVFWEKSGLWSRIWQMQICEGAEIRRTALNQFSDQPGTMTFRWQKHALELPLPRYWEVPSGADGRLYWESGGEDCNVFFQDEPCAVPVRLEMAKAVRRRLGRNFQLIIEEKDFDGKVLAIHELAAEQGSLITFSRKLASDTVSLVLSARYYGRTVLHGGTLRILSPGDSCGGMELRGSGLYLAGQPVCFRCSRPVAEKSLPSGGCQSRQIYLFQNTCGIDRQHLLELNQQSRHFFGLMEQSVSPGASGELQEWLDCFQMAEMKPETALLNLNFRRIASEGDFPGFFRKMCFMIQFLQAHRIRPVLVCQPVFARDNRAMVRLKALYTKEFAWKYGLEVLDFYSLALKADLSDEGVFAEKGGMEYQSFAAIYQEFFLDCLRRFFHVTEN